MKGDSLIGNKFSGPTLFIGTLRCNRKENTDVTLLSAGGLSLAFLNKSIVGFGALGMIMIYITCAKLAIERKRYYAVITHLMLVVSAYLLFIYKDKKLQ